MLARLIGVTAARPGFADEVVLRNGAVFAGIVREEGERVVLEVDCGTITFRRSEIREVRRTGDPLKELERAEWERGRFHLHWVGGFPGEEKTWVDRPRDPGREDEW